MKINGDRIKQEMKRKKITQQKLADLIEIDRSEISYWIRGKRGANIKKIRMLSKVLEISVDEITDGKPIKYGKMVSVVRCKDCKHQNEYKTGSCPYYTTWWSVAPDDWFCADGERR